MTGRNGVLENFLRSVAAGSMLSVVAGSMLGRREGGCSEKAVS